MKIIESSEISNGNNGQEIPNVESHGWYFNAISACANGTWLEGGLPSSEDFTDVAISWMESTSWTLVDWIFNMGNTALNTSAGMIGVSAPKIPSPTTMFTKDALGNLMSWLNGGKPF
jgi:hypothetical protein